MPSEPVLRPMTVADVPKVLDLFPRVGWKYAGEQLQANISWGGQGSFCLEDNDRLVGTANVVTYGSDLAWVGMVVVDPDYQRRGLARRLMVACMDYCETNHIRTVMLDASELGYGLYDDLGFHPLYRIESWTGVPQNLTGSDHIRPMTVDDLPAVAALDAQLFGLPRYPILRWLQQFGGWVDTINGQVNGYIFAHAAHTGRVGAWYHRDAEGANALLQAALLSFAGEAEVRLDIPASNEHARALAARYGLSTQRGCIRMLWGQTPAPGRMSEQYAIIGFATG